MARFRTSSSRSTFRMAYGYSGKAAWMASQRSRFSCGRSCRQMMSGRCARMKVAAFCKVSAWMWKLVTFQDKTRREPVEAGWELFGRIQWLANTKRQPNRITPINQRQRLFVQRSNAISTIRRRTTKGAAHKVRKINHPARWAGKWGSPIRISPMRARRVSRMFLNVISIRILRFSLNDSKGSGCFPIEHRGRRFVHASA